MNQQHTASSSAKWHIIQHTCCQERCVVCGVCGEVVSTVWLSLQVSGDSRLVQTSSNHPITCPICHKTSVTGFAICAHMIRQHTGGWVFMCNQCDYKTNRSHDLKRHLKSRHQGALQRPYRCSVCPYRTTYVEHLQAHLSSRHPHHAQQQQQQQQQD